MKNINFVEGPEQTIKCEKCNRPMIHYMVYAPEAEMTQSISVLCPHDKHQSWPVTIQGLFKVGPIGEDEQYAATIIKDIKEVSENNWIFEIGIK